MVSVMRSPCTIQAGSSAAAEPATNAAIAATAILVPLMPPSLRLPRQSSNAVTAASTSSTATSPSVPVRARPWRAPVRADVTMFTHAPRGPLRSASVVRKMATVGVPSAAARWTGPVSPPTTARHDASSRASSGIDVGGASSAHPPAAATTRRPSSSSLGPTTTSGRHPAAARRLASSPYLSAGQHFPDFPEAGSNATVRLARARRVLATGEQEPAVGGRRENGGHVQRCEQREVAVDHVAGHGRGRDRFGVKRARQSLAAMAGRETDPAGHAGERRPERRLHQALGVERDIRAKRGDVPCGPPDLATNVAAPWGAPPPTGSDLDGLCHAGMRRD